MPTTGRHRGPPPPPPRRPAVAPVLGVLLVGCAVVVLVGAAAAGRVAAPRRPGPSALASSPGPWVAVVEALDARRAAAYADGSTSQLAAVYAPSSPAGARDAAALQALVAAGGTAHGVRPQVRTGVALSPPGAGPDGTDAQVVLDVVDALPPVIVVDASGRSSVRAGRGERRWRLTLVRVAGDWRIQDVAAA